MRRIIRDLVPVEVDKAGLTTALQSLAERTREDFGTACEFHPGDTVAVENSLLATHIYRIAQEAVANAVQHASPTRISIRLSNKDGVLLLRVADDGIGIASHSSEAGFGLRSMAHRAELIGGELTIERSDEGGTIVQCRVPTEIRP